MGFSVESDAVAALGKQVERLSEDALQGKSYVVEHTDINLTGEGLVNLIAGGHRQVQDQVENFLQKLADPTASSTAEALEVAARQYRSTDNANSAELDATYPSHDVAKARRGVEEVVAQVGVFEDVADPASRYKPPQDYNDDGDYAYEPDWWDLASPSSLVRDAIWKVTDAATALGICDRAYDPYEVVLKPVVGDWAGMRACADVFRNMGAATEDMATDIRWSAQSINKAWTGNAADSCQVHLLALASSLESAKKPLNDIAQEYQAASEGAVALRRAVGTLLSDISDAALTAAASAAVAGASGTTGVGLPIALVVGAFTLTRVYKVVNGLLNLLDLIGRIAAVVDTVNGAGNDFGKVDATNPLPALPGNSMTVPG